MKFITGYKLTADSTYIDDIILMKKHIYEVYFSFGSMPNGRNSTLLNADFLPFEASVRQLADLKRLSKEGISLNLLLNANCYGKDSLSRKFFSELGDTVDYLVEGFTLSSVTATSPIIAKFIKTNFPSLEVRASVNMRVGTAEGMDCLKQYFDGYYMQREYNRNFEHIKALRAWCNANEKKLYMLANSGCLNFCPAQVFHDNLVAHETEISAMDNAYEFNGICHEYLKEPKNYSSLITNTSFVRPEDMHLYEGLFNAVKLATRVSKNPSYILKSYANARYHGNILDILEPAHSIYPYAVENGSPLKIVKISEDIALCGYNENNNGEELC